jgi:CRP-like cAMP-binding protein
MVYGSVPTVPPEFSYSAHGPRMNNRILKALPQKEYRLIEPNLSPLNLARGTVLYEAGASINDLYFPEEAAISYLSGTADGETLEVCAIGNEGVVGISSILANATGFRAVVQLPGVAYRVPREIVRREFLRCETLHRLLLHYTNALLVQIAQTAVCNKFHSVEERFCRWLLMAHDRSVTDDVPLTQEALARILGSRRASVSVTASAFQKREVIRYSRGVIRILNREHLENASCECYETISAAHSKIDN